jgi:NAD(P)-dependent dehydrogenase (short-subunit alcohol dehydrogenase family)
VELRELRTPQRGLRWRAAEEIAEAIVYLATERASFAHGAVLPVDGGRIAVQARRLVRAVGVAVSGSSGHGCFG